jgi:hypothetical protein
MWDRFRNWAASTAQSADSRIAGEAAKRAIAARDSGIERNRNTFLYGRPDEMSQVVGQLDNLTEEQTRGLLEEMKRNADTNKEYRPGMADMYASRMNRGPMGIGQMGMAERANDLIANNVYVRRGVLPTAVAGGGIMGGALVTEGAQQLMALMGFMQQGAEQQERAEQSPLA